MTHFAATEPSMHDIGDSQNEDRNIRRQLAKAHFYKVGNLWHFAGSAMAIVFALVSPVVLLWYPDQGPLLGALAGIWIFASRLVFEPIKLSYQLKGAAVQELFDCDVLGLTWNDVLVREPSDEEIRSASRAIKKQKKVAGQKNWYPAQVACEWPRSVIICQRANSVWSRRQQRAYGKLLVCLAVLWALCGIVLALIHHASLAEYLTTIALPSLPAVLDATDLSKNHFKASTRLQEIEDASNALFDSSSVVADDLREIQDLIFDFRREAPPVAGWFYRVLAKKYEADMRYAAGERADR